MKVKWIKIVTDLFDDEKILLIESLPEADQIIVVWLKLLCLAGKINNDGMITFSDKIPYTDEMLATIFRRKISTIRLALETFERLDMVEIVKDTICIPNWEKHQNVEGLEKIREQRKIRQQNYRNNHKLLTNNVDVTLRNGTDIDIEGDIEGDIDKEKEKDIVSKFVCNNPPTEHIAYLYMLGYSNEKDLHMKPEILKSVATKWYNHYSSEDCNWTYMAGGTKRTKMKDWKSKCRDWVLRENK